jgi:hypothetical protein
MEAIRSSKTSVQTRCTRYHTPEDGIFHSQRRENLKSSINQSGSPDLAVQNSKIQFLHATSENRTRVLYYLMMDYHCSHPHHRCSPTPWAGSIVRSWNLQILLMLRQQTPPPGLISTATKNGYKILHKFPWAPNAVAMLPGSIRDTAKHCSDEVKPHARTHTHIYQDVQTVTRESNETFSTVRTAYWAWPRLRHDAVSIETTFASTE